MEQLPNIMEHLVVERMPAAQQEAAMLWAEGATPDEICQHLDVDAATFRKWSRSHAFAEAIYRHAPDIRQAHRILVTAMLRGVLSSIAYLTGIVEDETADPKRRDKAAVELARLGVPKQAKIELTQTRATLTGDQLEHMLQGSRQAVKYVQSVESDITIGET